MALSNKQQAFVSEYLQCFNATEAALRAGYSEKTAHATGWENLKKPEIANAISQRLQESAMSADEVLMRLAEQARGIHSTYIDASGVVNIAQMVADGKTHLIKKIKDTRNGREYEFYDAQAALSLLGKHHGLFVDRQELTGKVGGAIEVKSRPDLSKLSVDELLALRQMMSKANNGTADPGGN